MLPDRKEKTVASLPARRVDQVLLDLIAIRRRWREGDPVTVPQATLHLRSGRDLSGWVVALESGALLLQTGHESQRNATYLDPAQVEAITVHDAMDVAPFLSDGRISGVVPPPADGTPPPSRLDVKRKLVEHQAAFSKVTGGEAAVDVAWEGIEDGEPMRTLLSLVADTVDVLSTISRRDAEGKEAVAKVKKLWFGDGGIAALRQMDTIVVTSRFKLGPAGRLSKSDLLPALEKIL